MRVLLIGNDGFTQALAGVIRNEKGPDGLPYVVTTSDAPLPAQEWHPARASVHEIVIVHWTDGDDETLLDSFLAVIPIVILVVAVPKVPFCVRAIRRGIWDYVETTGDSIEAILVSMYNAVDILGVGRGPKDLEWIRREFMVLWGQHPGQWIAVRDGEVVGSDVVFARLHRRDETRNAVFWKMPEAPA